MSEECPRVVPRPTLLNATSHLSHLIEKDAGLIVTPEKFSMKQKISSPHQDENEAPKLPPGVLINTDLKEKQVIDLRPEISDLIPTKLSSFANDPTLDVTPEKSTVLKPARGKKQISDLAQETDVNKEKNPRNLHVRFDVPEQLSESETTTSEISDDLERNNKNKLSKDSFQTRAALYVQRNPLADITSDSSLQETSENTTETFTSIDSDNGSLFKKITQFIENNGPSVADMHGKVIRGETKVIQTLPQVKLKTTQKQSGKDIAKITKNNKSKIINVVSQEKQGPPRSVIDHITRPKTSSSSSDVSEKKPFLKKKSGLHRHEHSVRYNAEVESDQNTLSGPTYNSTLSLGQELQELKITEFDAKDAVKKKLAESERLRNYVAEKTAEATNINPDEKLYQNLVSVEVPEEDILPTNASWKRIKPKPFKPKKMKHGEPNIMDRFNPEELFYEEPFLEIDWKLPVPGREQMPLEHVMSIDEHYRMWNGV